MIMPKKHSSGCRLPVELLNSLVGSRWAVGWMGVEGGGRRLWEVIDTLFRKKLFYN